jgi:hypothetical protein
MKARASILTIGMSLALIAPAAHAAGTPAKAPGCGSGAKHAASNIGTSSKSPFASQSSRALQLVLVGDGAASSQPIRTPCGVNKITAAVAPNRFQVLRNSL